MKKREALKKLKMPEAKADNELLFAEEDMMDLEKEIGPRKAVEPEIPEMPDAEMPMDEEAKGEAEAADLSAMSDEELQKELEARGFKVQRESEQGKEESKVEMSEEEDLF